MNAGEHVTQAARAYSRGLRVLYGLDGHTPEQAAALAWQSGGPSLDQLITDICTRRGLTAAA